MIGIEFFRDENVVAIAQKLLGKEIVTICNNGKLSSGIISETEAYNGITDKACHAYNNKRTERTEVMFMNGGVAYVYLCYGMHHLFNIVTGKENNPQAVLIRSIIPYKGLEIMSERYSNKTINYKSGMGPGRVTKLLGIDRNHNKKSICCPELYLRDANIKIKKTEIITTPRIGVDYAGDDALLPYRFLISNDRIDQIINQIKIK